MSTGTHPTAHPTRGIKINNELACANAEATLTLVPVGITDGNFWQSPDMVGWTFSLLLGTRMSHHHRTQLFSPERVHYRNIISISSVDTIECCGLKSTCVNFGVYGYTVVARNPPRLDKAGCQPSAYTHIWCSEYHNIGSNFHNDCQLGRLYKWLTCAP